MFERADRSEHPERCQSVNSHGQCLNLGILFDNGEHGSHCLAHGGNSVQVAHVKETVRNYRLTVARFKAQLEEKADAESIKSLREEVAILRICLEERLNKCHDAMDLILQSGAISDMVMKINTVVQSCHKLEGSMGQLLDKTAILQFAQTVISIISGVLESQPDHVNQIADAILQSIGDTV